MPTLWQKINEDLKTAMKEKKVAELGTLRMFLAALKNKKIEKIQKEDLSDEDVISVASTEIKKRRDSILLYEQGGRVDLADTEKAEILIFERYTPAQMSAEEIEKSVREIVEPMKDADMNQFGAIMGQAMAKLKGKADGILVKDIVRKILGAK
jgi:uncharacterized protein